MASIQQVRGAFLEEIVLLLLDRSGYRRVRVGEEGTRNGGAGLEVEGRGSCHQIDALVTPLHSHAFVYPVRLMVEAKCEATRVGLRTVRSVAGCLYDINQNFFAGPLVNGRQVPVRRFNYHAAVFSANGYSQDAEQYALAHQIFLIDYSNAAAMRPVVDALLSLQENDLEPLGQMYGRGNLTRMREAFRQLLERVEIEPPDATDTWAGARRVNDELLSAIRDLRGSYYGMIEGIYPVHLISRQSIPVRVIREQRVIPCEIRVSEDTQTWAFEPSGIPRTSPEFFRLEFTIPEFVADMLSARARDRYEERVPEWLLIANAKRQYMRFVDITTVEDGHLLAFRLALDSDWLDRYVEGRQARDNRRREQGARRR